MLVVELAPKVAVIWRTLKMMTLNPPISACYLMMEILLMYPGVSTIHIVIQSDFSRVVVEKVRDASAAVLVPTSEVNTEGETLGTFNA